MQAIEEELLGSRVPGSPIDNLYENASPREYQLWWDHYKRYNPTSITTLFYGYSITSTLCSHCQARCSTLSAFNTLYIPLPLTQTRVNVNLVHQFLDLPTGHVSLRTEPISVKVGLSASLRDVRAAVLASLASQASQNSQNSQASQTSQNSQASQTSQTSQTSQNSHTNHTNHTQNDETERTEEDIALLIGTYDLATRSIESYRLASLEQSVESLQSDGQRNFFLLAYPVRLKTALDGRCPLRRAPDSF